MKAKAELIDWLIGIVIAAFILGFTSLVYRGASKEKTAPAPSLRLETLDGHQYAVMKDVSRGLGHHAGCSNIVCQPKERSLNSWNGNK